ncbi:MAG TPA: AraC family ligand binding domain-containing protein [Longimicrobiaceae bacterium]
MKVLSLETARTREDRPATAVAHDEENARVVTFDLLPGQRVPPHRNASTVIVSVVAGSGTFRGADGAALLRAGEMAVYAPGEEHSIEAGEGPLSFVAVIAPRP